MPNTTSDQSNLFEPSYTFPAPGSYTAQLIVNPGNNCTDTAYIDIIVNNPLTTSWSAPDSLCLSQALVTFNAQANDPTATFSWTFPPSASVLQAQGSTVPNVTFSQAGYQPVFLEAQTNFCQATYTDSILLFGDPIADFMVPNQVQCLGYTIGFTNNSQNTFNYAWDFGFGQTSTQSSPTVTFPAPGLYPVTLIASSTGACTDTTATLVQIGEPIILSMTHTDSLCIDFAFAFDAQVSGPGGTQYFWDFGPNANPQTSA